MIGTEGATSLNALPCNGLKDKIKIKLWPDATEIDLPSVHTCAARGHGAHDTTICPRTAARSSCERSSSKRSN